MTKTIFFTITFIFVSNAFPNSDTIEYSVPQLWDILDKKILLLQIDKEEGAKLLDEYEQGLVKYFMENGGRYVQRRDWAFPLANFTSVTHREEGNDYRETNYDYFQGSDSKGHPAHDIFILDSDKDLLDDETGKPVDVVTMCSGVVVATFTTWAPGSYLRGGNYVKIFDPTNYKFFYYSHLSQVNVEPGDIVDAGDKIGEVGRTGRKTILPGGKTHLHISLLKSVNGYPVPEPIIDDIWKSKENYLNGKK